MNSQAARFIVFAHRDKAPPGADLRNIRAFYEKGLHWEFEKADTEGDAVKITRLVRAGYLDAMLFHFRQLGWFFVFPTFQSYLESNPWFAP